MSLTPQQLAALKAHVLATPALADLGRNDTALKDALNAASTFMVWRSITPVPEILDAILWDRLTPLDAPDGTQLSANRELRCQTKQMNLQTLLQGREQLATGRSNIRAALADALTKVPSAAGGVLQDAGWLGEGRVKATITRAATECEKLFATGTGTAGAPGSLVFEGDLSVADIGDMWNNG